MYHSACVVHRGDASSPSLALGGGVRTTNKRKNKMRTLHHLPSCECVLCTLLVTWRVIKEEDGLGISPSEPLEDVNSVVNLGE